MLNTRQQLEEHARTLREANAALQAQLRAIEEAEQRILDEMWAEMRSIIEPSEAG